MANQFEKRRNSGLDCLKAIMAFLVVCIHAPFPGEFGQYFRDLCRLAVPCFFMISGFLYPRCIAKGGEIIQLKRIAKLAFTCLVVYFAWSWIFYKCSGQDFSYICDQLFNIEGLIKLFVLNNVVFGYPLWYLMAFVCVLLIVYVSRKLKLERLLIYASPLLVLPSIIMGSYADVIFGKYISIYFARNCYFIGIPFFCAGWWIAENYERIRSKLNKKFLLCGVILSALLGFAEHFALNKMGFSIYGDIYFSTPLYVLFTFLYFLEFVESDGFLSKLGRNYSTGIYVSHAIAIDMLYDMFSKTPLLDAFMIVRPVLVFVVSYGVVVLYKKLFQKKVKQ